MMIIEKIPTYILNLDKRRDRCEHILNEFEGKNEFNFQLVRPAFGKNGAASVWNIIKFIINELLPTQENLVLICEDDHVFTDAYNKNLLLHYIDQASTLNAEILSGGVSCLGDAIPLETGMLWMDKFTR